MNNLDINDIVGKDGFFKTPFVYTAFAISAYTSLMPPFGTTHLEAAFNGLLFCLVCYFIYNGCNEKGKFDKEYYKLALWIILVIVFLYLGDLAVAVGIGIFAHALWFYFENIYS